MNFIGITARLPIIHDIPVQDLWKPPIYALTAYLGTVLLRKIVPLEPEADRRPILPKYFRMIHLDFNSIKRQCRNFYTQSQIFLEYNLPIAVFIVAIKTLKSRNIVAKEEVSLAILLLAYCTFSAFMRISIGAALIILASFLPRHNAYLTKVAQLSEKVACLMDREFRKCVPTVRVGGIDAWREINRPADLLSFQIDYEGIPEAHRGNAVFACYTCDLTGMPMRFPVTAPNRNGERKYQFERSAIIEWLRGHRTNPVNGELLRLHEVRENLQMRQLIEQEMRNVGLL